jgi:hypothetical protein
MFEVSRSVFDGRFLYVRHFLPHLPYIQRSIIFDDSKDSFRELRKLHQAGKLNEHAERMWASRKPVEELYDLKTDPHELNNLADSPDFTERKQELVEELRRWILDHRDSGFLPEAEYQIRAAETDRTPFEFAQNPRLFNLHASLNAAWLVGDPSVSRYRIHLHFQHQEAGVRYWSAVALQARSDHNEDSRSVLTNALGDSSSSVRIAAAVALLTSSQPKSETESKALETLGEVLQDDRPWVALEAASALAQRGNRAIPLVPVMKQVVNKNRSKPGSRRPYKDFNYASFTGWALETALDACGETRFVEAISE